MTQELEGFKPTLRAPGNPLRRFQGTLQGYKGVPVTFGARQVVNVEFNFTDLDVLESVEPYLFPIATITVRYTPPGDRGQAGQGNRWEVLAASIRHLMGPENSDIDSLVGKRQEWAMLPATLRLPLVDADNNPIMMEDDEGNQVLGDDGKPRQAWGDVEDPSWKVVMIEGVGTVKEVDQAFNDHLCTLADGKDERGFYEAAFADPQVTAKPALVQAITDRKLLQTLLDAGSLARDANGILHKQATTTASDEEGPSG